jgi:hypothetical protein
VRVARFTAAFARILMIAILNKRSHDGTRVGIQGEPRDRRGRISADQEFGEGITGRVVLSVEVELKTTASIAVRSSIGQDAAV